jgi:hypothetical protein
MDFGYPCQGVNNQHFGCRLGTYVGCMLVSLLELPKFMIPNPTRGR